MHLYAKQTSEENGRNFAISSWRDYDYYSYDRIRVLLRVHRSRGQMREILKRNDSRIAQCAIVDGPQYSYAQLPTGFQFEVAPLCVCGEEFCVEIHKDGSITHCCEECDTEIWAPAPVNMEASND